MTPSNPHPAEPEAKRASKRRLPIALSALAVAFAVVASPIVFDVNRAALAAPAGVSAPASFAPLAERVLPTVVTVATVQNASAGEGSDGPMMPDLPPGSPLEKFFRQFMDPQGPGRSQPHRKMQGLGSGFIVDKDGTIVTNNHVVDGADEISVVLHNGQRLDAKLLGTDPKTDLAVIKIDPGKIDGDKTLTVAKFGDSDTAKIGDWILAVGNPFGLGGTVTAGVISARSRVIGSGPFDDFLQIDASINRGNSGGPTFDMSGHVVGVNTAIFSPNGGSVGIGFAIPSNIAKDVVAQLKATGHVRRAWMGVQIQEVTPDIASSLGLEKHEGALVVNVVPKSPAANAELKSGDVLLAFDGKKIDKVRNVPRMVASAGIGTAHELTLWRNGDRKTVSITLAEMKEEPQVAENESGAKAEEAGGKLGLAVAPLGPKAREKFGIAESVSGVVVTDVRDDSPAADKGIRPGDVIVKVGGNDATSPKMVKEAVEQATTQKRQAVLFLVNRNGNDRFVAIPLPRA